MTTLAEEFSRAWQGEGSMDEVLARLVLQMGARASGCWRLEQGVLNLIGFGWASDMPMDVSQGFQDATRHVPLDQTGLGIVKAAVSGLPAIGRRDAGATGLEGSANWIVRFAANTSLAVPIHGRDQSIVIGVIAVSTAAFVEHDDPLWQTLLRLARDVGGQNS